MGRHRRTLVLLLCGLPVVALGEAPDGEHRIRIEFKAERWGNVLQWIAKENGMNLAMDDPPPGRFTYSDPQLYTPAEALDVLHSVLLDRGITLIVKEGLLITARLGDDMPWELVPFVPADKLDRVAPHEMVTTTLPLHSVTGDLLAPEIEKVLTARGRVLGNKVANRLVISDRAGVATQVRDLLALIDPPLDPNAVRLRVFSLKYAAVREVEPVVREILGPIAEKKAGGGSGLPIDPEAIQDLIFSRNFLESFTPGISMEGIGREKPKEKLQTRLTVDPVRNALLIVAEPNVLGKVERLVVAMDRPASLDSAAPIVIRSYELKTGQGEKFAARLRTLMAQTGDCMITGIDRLIVVRGTKAHHEDVKRLLSSMTASDESLAAFKLSRRRAEELAPQIERLFEIDGQKAPRILADANENAILVRGSPEQIEQVRRILTDLEELTPDSPASPGVQISSPGK